jgi:hypothetical protein
MSSIFQPASSGPGGEAEQSVELRYAAVSLRRLTSTSAMEKTQPHLLEACYRLTSRVKPITTDSALLDLGRCTATEALCALQNLLARLALHGAEGRACIGPTPVVAQLASQWVARADAQQLFLVSTADTPGFLRQAPIERLLTLTPPDAITGETLAHLRRSGVRTLGQLARLDELTLRRQFGRMGGHLAALAEGKSLHPFNPTPPPRTLRFCLRSTDPFSADDALRQLPRLATGMAKALHAQRYETGQITVIIQWASGACVCLIHPLRQRVHTSRLLTQELARVVDSALRQSGGEQIDAIRCTLSNLRRPQPSQPLLLPQGRSPRSARQAQTRDLADTLTQRRKRTALLSSQRVAEHAIFSEDGYILAPFSDIQGRAIAAESHVSARRQDGWQDTSLRLHWW